MKFKVRILIERAGGEAAARPVYAAHGAPRSIEARHADAALRAARAMLEKEGLTVVAIGMEACDDGAPAVAARVRRGALPAKAVPGWVYKGPSVAVRSASTSRR